MGNNVMRDREQNHVHRNVEIEASTSNITQRDREEKSDNESTESLESAAPSSWKRVTRQRLDGSPFHNASGLAPPLIEEVAPARLDLRLGFCPGHIFEQLDGVGSSSCRRRAPVAVGPQKASVGGSYLYFISFVF